MGRALEALAEVGIEVLAFSSSSYRQNFCFLIRKDELAAALEGLESEFELELEVDYLQPIKVDPEVGLLAVVGEEMQGTPGLAGRIFTAISRENVNIIAIAQGSSELRSLSWSRAPVWRRPAGRTCGMRAWTDCRGLTDRLSRWKSFPCRLSAPDWLRHRAAMRA